MDRILSLEISMHAYSENVYNQIVRDGNYKKVMDNLLFLSGLKKQGKIPFFKFSDAITTESVSTPEGKCSTQMPVLFHNQQSFL